MERILGHVPNQEFNTSPRVLTNAWREGIALRKRTADYTLTSKVNTYLAYTRPSVFSGPFSTMEFAQKGPNGENFYKERNPGLVLATRLLTVAAGMDPNAPKLKSDMQGRIDPMSITGEYIANIVAIANGYPEGFSDTMSPRERQVFPTFETTNALPQCVSEILKYRYVNRLERIRDKIPDTSSDSIATLQEIASGQNEAKVIPPMYAELQQKLVNMEGILGDVPQFAGEKGLRNLIAITKAMDVYEDVFQPRPETPNP